MFSRIRTKVVALIIFNAAVALTFLGAVFYWISSRSLESQQEESLKTTASVLAAQWDGSLLVVLKPGMENASLYQSFLKRLERLRQQTDLDRIYIIGQDRTNIVSTSPDMRIGQALPRLELLRNEFDLAWRGKPSASVLIQVEDRFYKSALAPIYAGDRPAAILMVDISPHYLAYMRSFRNSLFGLGLIALVCCIVTAHYFSRTITTPISRMVGGVEQISKANYEQPLSVEGSDELSHLAGSIETMRQKILHRDTQMKMMLSGIAHEIRNPLGGIELFAGILEKEIKDPDQRRRVDRIQSEVRNLKCLLNEFLDYARPQKLDIKDVEVLPLLTEIQTLYEEDIREKNAGWNLEIAPEVRSVSADPLKLKQALLNLYKNALQAVPAEDARVITRVHRNGAGVLLEIQNNLKAGIDAETSRKLFEPFFTTKEKGMGLGLPLAKGIIEAHGGELKLTEHNASHVTFAIKLPYRNTAS